MSDFSEIVDEWINTNLKAKNFKTGLDGLGVIDTSDYETEFCDPSEEYTEEEDVDEER